MAEEEKQHELVADVASEQGIGADVLTPVLAQALGVVGSVEELLAR